ncbi:MAG: tol-pal system-associated acyl-CoA thioesterase [Proteobacteria bacterium]|nr:tol-pal system-associated acyl-CoA thioesterase [Pseudomonadota bacterium]
MIGNPAAILAIVPHRYDLRVYYEDTDAGGIVYYANYLRFAERARTEALRALGVPHAALVRDHQRMFVVRRVKLDYLRPARLDAPLWVLTDQRGLGAASVRLRQDVVGVEGVCATAAIDLACVRTDTGRPARIPPAWRDALAGLQAAAAAG